MKRIAAALLVLLLLLMTTGCSDLSLFFGDPDTPSSAAFDERYRRELEGAWCYQRLSGRLRAGYEQMYAAVRAHEDTDEGLEKTDKGGSTRWALHVTLSDPLHSRQEASQLYLALTSDHPRFFFLDNQYSVGSYRRGDTEYFATMNLYFLWDAPARREAAARLDKAVDDVLSSVDVAAADFERELTVHDRLTAICTYETAALEVDEPVKVFPHAFTAYGALVEGRAVCEGYARAFQLLLQRVGLDCTLVNGTDVSGMSHMWNLVTVDGHNYHVDPTWNDTGDKGHHTYFNLTTQDVERSHTIGEDNIGVDTCTVEDANYFRRQGLWLDTLQRDEIVRAIAGEVRRGRPNIELRFSEETFANARLFINNSALVVREVNALLSPDGLVLWDYDKYGIDETYHILTLYNA